MARPRSGRTAAVVAAVAVAVALVYAALTYAVGALLEHVFGDMSTWSWAGWLAATATLCLLGAATGTAACMGALHASDRVLRRRDQRHRGQT